MAPDTSTPTETVRAFMDAVRTGWPEGDAATMASFFSENAVYCNGPLVSVQGRGAISATSPR
jgi:limonene-1,2-epoxide hydrolase